MKRLFPSHCFLPRLCRKFVLTNCALFGIAFLLPAVQPAAPEQLPSYFKTGILDFESRVWAQTQIERVYYNHRIWPKENPQPKPEFESVLSRAVLREIVRDQVKKMNALEKFWNIAVT